jgi:5,10-methylenetetrahydromethanopterin reductase
VAKRVRTDIFDAGFNHVVLALADREIPRLWAGTEIPGLPTVSEQVRLIAERVLPLITA